METSDGDIHREGYTREYRKELIYEDDGESRIVFHPPTSWLLTIPKEIPVSLYVNDQVAKPAISYTDASSCLAKRCVECPFLYVLNGTDSLAQNNILNASVDTSGGGHLVFDYLFLQDDPLPQAGKYEFMVREDESSIDSLDWAKLITIDHQVGSRLALSPNGGLFEILLTVAPSAAVDDRGNNVLPQLLYADDIYYSREDSGWLELTYDGLDTMGLALGDATTGITPGGPGKTPTSMTTGERDPNILTVSVIDSLGNWIEEGRLFSRSRPHPSFVNLTKYFLPSMHVRYSWNIEYEADFIGFNWVKPITQGISILEPSMATLNDTINVIDQLKMPDRRFAGFGTDEFIRLSFPYNAIPPGKDRDFVFLCRGKYSMGDSLMPPKVSIENDLPRRFCLYQNYPNPFNSTTIINFDLPEAAETRMVIYNILGQQVAAPVDATLPAGSHSVTWDGRNSFGKRVSCGVYFYVISAREHHAVKKLLLLK